MKQHLISITKDDKYFSIFANLQGFSHVMVECELKNELVVEITAIHGETVPLSNDHMGMISEYYIRPTASIAKMIMDALNGYTNETVPRSPLQTVPSELRFEKNKKLLCRSAP